MRTFSLTALCLAIGLALAVFAGVFGIIGPAAVSASSSSGNPQGPKKSTATPTPTLTATATSTATATATATPSATPTASPTASATATATLTPTVVNSDAVAYQIDPAHSGRATSSLSAPLARKWSVNLGGSISYPIIAQGKVFVTVANANSNGTQLYALDATSGQTVWGPLAIGGTYFWSSRSPA
jgi:outer membrane protein assembly factor BamB